MKFHWEKRRWHTWVACKVGFQAAQTNTPPASAALHFAQTITLSSSAALNTASGWQSSSSTASSLQPNQQGFALAFSGFTFPSPQWIQLLRNSFLGRKTGSVLFNPLDLYLFQPSLAFTLSPKQFLPNLTKCCFPLASFMGGQFPESPYSETIPFRYLIHAPCSLIILSDVFISFLAWALNLQYYILSYPNYGGNFFFLVEYFSSKKLFMGYLTRPSWLHWLTM